MSIGSLYNARGVTVGQAAGFFSQQYSALPADRLTLFDETGWIPTVVSLGDTTTGTFTITLSGGALAAPVTTTALSKTSVAADVIAAIRVALISGGVRNLTPIVLSTSAGGPFTIALSGPGAYKVLISATGTLTGGTTGPSPLVTPPVWSPFGATEQGWSVNYNPNTTDITVEEQQTPVGRTITGATYTFDAQLAEDTVDNLQVALSASRVITAPGIGVYGTDELSLTDQLPVIAVALETKNFRGLPRFYYVPQATCAIQVTQAFRRSDGERMIPVSFSSVCPTSDIKIRDITANKTG